MKRVRAFWAAVAVAMVPPAAWGQIYVRATGNDNNSGTVPFSPVRTIQRGIDLAAGTGEPIFVAAGSYSEDFDFEDGIHIFGSFSLDFSYRDAAPLTDVLRDYNGIRQTVGVTDILIDGIIFVSSDAPAPGANSPGLTSNPLFFKDSSNIFISNCRFEAGNGSNGANGIEGADGRDGPNGNPGQAGCEDSTGLGCDECAQPQGGLGGLALVAWGSHGGRGGNAGHGPSASGSPGEAGYGPGAVPNAGGAGGAGVPPSLGDNCPGATYQGSAGAWGAVGTHGLGGAGLGSFTASGYTPAARGGDGTDGGHGSGGGGGGGGGGGDAGCDSYGGGGGGGGAGGEGGKGGTGGNAGGGSFALWFSNCTGVVVVNCALITEGGGAGGQGGSQGLPGFGGLPGAVGCAGNPYGGSGEQDDASNGGWGGTGGFGGIGGFGGGGGGGPTYGLVNVDTGPGEPVAVSGNTFNLGPAAPGGTSSNSGATGARASTFGSTSAQPVSPDCNNNGTHDEVDIVNGAADCNDDGIPDSCQLAGNDCNTNGVPDDVCEVALGDNFESYTAGTDLHQQGGWKGWDNSPAAGALVSTAQARRGAKSVDIQGPSDLVHEFLVARSGQWTLTAWQYVPSGLTGVSYFLLLNTYNDGGPYNWSTQVEFDRPAGLVRFFNQPATLPLLVDQWVRLRVEIDLVANSQTIYYGDSLLLSTSWTEGASGGGVLNIGALNLFAGGASSVFYDDVTLVAQPVGDCNANGQPDDCEVDCNTNGVPDECDIAEGTSADCDTNGVPDECDIADGFSADCNTNGVPDSCELNRMAKMYWTDANNDVIERSDLDGGNRETLVSYPGDANPRGIDIDEVGRKMYWIADLSNSIQRANLNGSDVEVLVATGLNGPRQLSLDVDNGKMYWADLATDTITRANLDGSQIEVLLDAGDGLVDPQGVVLDFVHQRMYWTDSAAAVIGQANFDGTSPAIIASSGVGSPRYIAVDPVGGHLYWTNLSGSPQIRRSDLDGQNIVNLIDNVGQAGGIDLDLQAGKIYWAGEGLQRIERANLDGSEREIVLSALANPQALALGLASDCNTNGVPDECELAGNDCNSNGVPDECELSGTDCNANGVADVCEPDCNSNDIADECDLPGPTELYLPAATYPVGDEPVGLAFGDLDGDGDLDMVTGNQNGNTISVLLNDGAGTFAAHVPYATGGLPRSVAIGDLDGDGDQDVAAVNTSLNRIQVFLNNGDATLASPVNYPGSNNPYTIAAGDLNHDGDLDLVTANFNVDRADVFLNSGGGIFTLSTSLVTGDGPTHVAVGDLNGDSVLDIVAANVLSDNVSVLLNNDNGTFAAGVPYGAGNGALIVAIGDLDGMNGPDLAVSNADAASVSVLLNNGGGTFAAAVNYPVGTTPVAIVAVDLDNDGDLDVATANEVSDDVSILLNNGDGSFAGDVRYGAGIEPEYIAVGDLNHDNLADLAVPYLGGDRVAVLLHALGDCNGNSIPDECELAGNDCNTNGLPDECDIAGGAADCNSDGVPDSCQLFGPISGEGFDNILTLPGDGWALINMSNPVGLDGWRQGIDGVFNAHSGPPTSFIAGNFNDAGNGPGEDTISNWLITPESTLQDGVTLTFWTRTKTASPFPDRLEVRMSLAGASTYVGPDEFSVGDFTSLMLEINPNLDLGGYPEAWTEFVVTVSGVAVPTNGRLALRYFVTDGGPAGANSDYVGIDTLSLTNPALGDCNTNGIPDECELAGDDCNTNGLPDECDLPGDGDGDGSITLSDWPFFTSCMTGPCGAAPCAPPLYADPCCGLLDRDADGDVDLMDAAIWLPAFGT